MIFKETYSFLCKYVSYKQWNSSFLAPHVAGCMAIMVKTTNSPLLSHSCNEFSHVHTYIKMVLNGTFHCT